ncbi:restriction endonuclease [Burkholderia multivorans]|uniref:restriction endonuclease n=1 Tax=Burkholderia multivorans TaxID=87883 RepID=UPI0021F12CF6|nr:restriction endonuclease [Burkholderia multivorans]
MEDFKSTPQAPNVFLALNTLGWKAFQDLCAQVCEVAFNRTVSVYREAQDGGQDAVFMLPARDRRDQSTEATVQCKFSSRADGRLRPSDISGELDTVRNLVSAGKASVYYFITNLGIDAPVASEIRDALTEAGVLEPHVLGREWLTLQIKSSSRLRALVPRVYGLGDLSTIVDERCAALELPL